MTSTRSSSPRRPTPTWGPRPPRRWYWAHALRLVGSYGIRRLRGARFGDFTPDAATGDTSGDGIGGLIRQARLSVRSLVRSPGFTVPALVILTIGMTAARRVREMGMRMALGAASGDVLTLMLRSSLTVALAGVALGIGASIGAGRLIRGMVPGVSPTDPLSFAIAGGLLLLVSGLATLVPARRAARTDPSAAVRAE